MAVTRRLSLVAVLVAFVAALAYLRDPSWLLYVTSGLGSRLTDEAGHPYRWTGGRASFFVPSEARTLELTMRALKDTDADWPINATISVDGRPSELVPFPDDAWRRVKIRLPPRGGRNVRRIDIHLDRVRRGQRGVQLREPVVDPS